MLICISITQILGHIYSIVDADSYTIHEKMFTLVKPHRIQQKCSVKNNKIMYKWKLCTQLSNLNFLLEVSLFENTK